MRAEPTEFELRIEFSGLCLFVKEKDEGGKKVGVAMPNARYVGDRLEHPDRTRAVPHVAYLRFDLANLAAPPAGVTARDPSDTPSYEIVHQLTREELDFGLPETQDGVDARKLALPNLNEFAPVKELLPDLFEPKSKPPAELVARTVLYGGELWSVLEKGVLWWMSGELHPERKPHVHEYGGEVCYRRTVNSQGMVLRLRSVDGNAAIEIPLRPTAAPGDKPAISLKIANLCATNPLEWGAFEPYGMEGPDKDFKWMYRLLRLKKDQDPKKYPASALPHPHPVPSANMSVFQDCFGAMITEAF